MNRGRGVEPGIDGLGRRPGEDGTLLARTAFGEKGSAQPGPRMTVASASAWALRTIAPTLPGSATHAGSQGAGGSPAAQARSQTAIALVPSRGRRNRRELYLDLLPVDTGARRDQDKARLPRRGEARREQVLALADEQALALAVLALGKLADQLQLLVLGAGDDRSVCLVLASLSWNANGPPEIERPAREKGVCGRELGGRTLPGELPRTAKRIAVVDGDVGEHLAVDSTSALPRPWISSE